VYNTYMRNIKLIVAYDGTDFCGWQLQPEVRTVQGVLTEALHTILREPIELNASSRTDAGVHAYGQTVNFITGSSIEPGKLLRGTNSRSPVDVSVQQVEEVDESFHSTFDATGKHYRYSVWRGQADDPLTRRYHWWYTYPVAIDAAREAAQLLTGTHDFKGLQVNSGKENEATLRTISRIDITEADERLFIDIYGKGFMYKQVRSMVGLILAVGRGKIASAEVPAVIAAGPEQRRTDVVPPQGLTLMKVYYDSCSA
jgi:tRNA pseudouridine38-40 synthase